MRTMMLRICVPVAVAHGACAAAAMATEAQAVNTEPGTDPALSDQVRPLPHGIEVQRHVVLAGRSGGGGSIAVPAGATTGTGRLVYSNTLGRWATGTTAGWLYGDDIATTAVAGCNLDRYVIKVTGDWRGDGSGVGPYSVDFAR